MDLTQLLRIEVPLIQAPMAGVQDSALTIAVSNAGALGSLPCAMFGPERLRAELERVRAGTERPYNVNFFCHRPPIPDEARERRWLEVLSPWYREFDIADTDIERGPGRLPFDHACADILEEFRPPVVSFHFGLPAPDLLARVKGWGARVLSSATTVDEALWLERHGADAIIAQGLEAGGHRGHFLDEDLSLQAGTFALVPRICEAVRLPVIAAGGIADRRGIAAARALGAAGVQLGTAFLLCDEATTGPLHRAALVEPRASHTALTNLFTGRPARGIVNRLMRTLGPMSDLTPDFPLATAAIAPLRARAEAEGSADCSPLWAGQNVSGCRAIPAAKLVRELS